MSYTLSVFLIVFFNLNLVYGHGNEIHQNVKVLNDVELDEDGFEIVSDAPSKETLEKINGNYRANIKKIFEGKCLSCHGVPDSLPWYYSLPGVKQLMDSDMEEAKKHMDMSNDFPFGGHGSPTDDLSALSKTIKNDDMPPLKYRVMHWDSKLTKAEIQAVDKWIEESQKRLNTK